MTTEGILTLTRLAQKYPSHRQVLLELMELELTDGSARLPATTKPTVVAEVGLSFPLEIFHSVRRGDQRGTRHVGKLYPDGTVDVAGKRHDSPSGAGSDLIGYQVNGWKWWQYLDPQSGRARPIDDLRRRGLLT